VEKAHQTNLDQTSPTVLTSSWAAVGINISPFWYLHNPKVMEGLCVCQTVAVGILCDWVTWRDYVPQSRLLASVLG